VALLRQCFDLTQGERGQAVSLIGEAGLGKSRLLHEFRQALAHHDCVWPEGRCQPYGMALAYGPVIEVLKQFFQIAASDRGEDICGLVRRGLEPHDGSKMLTALLDAPQIQDDLVTLVLDKTEGVPFFIEELVQSLRETAAIELHDGQWRITTSAAAVPVPDTVEEVLTARIDR